MSVARYASPLCMGGSIQSNRPIHKGTDPVKCLCSQNTGLWVESSLIGSCDGIESSDLYRTRRYYTWSEDSRLGVPKGKTRVGLASWMMDAIVSVEIIHSCVCVQCVCATGSHGKASGSGEGGVFFSQLCILSLAFSLSLHEINQTTELLERGRTSQVGSKLRRKECYLIIGFKKGETDGIMYESSQSCLENSSRRANKANWRILTTIQLV